MHARLLACYIHSYPSSSPPPLSLPSVPLLLLTRPYSSSFVPSQATLTLLAHDATQTMSRHSVIHLLLPHPKPIGGFRHSPAGDASLINYRVFRIHPSSRNRSSLSSPVRNLDLRLPSSISVVMVPTYNPSSRRVRCRYGKDGEGERERERMSMNQSTPSRVE